MSKLYTLSHAIGEGENLSKIIHFVMWKFHSFSICKCSMSQSSWLSSSFCGPHHLPSLKCNYSLAINCLSWSWNTPIIARALQPHSTGEREQHLHIEIFRVSPILASITMRNLMFQVVLSFESVRGWLSPAKRKSPWRSPENLRHSITWHKRIHDFSGNN